MEKKPLIELMALWEKTNSKGETYFSGSINGLNVLVFKNNNKKDAKHPDYRVMLGEKDREQKPAKKDDDSNSGFPF